MLTVRKAWQSDSDQFYAWRTDPQVVANSFSAIGIGKQDHLAWYDRKLSSDDCQLYVVLCDNEPAGQVRFDIRGLEATINYSLGAGFRAKGLATRSLQLAIAEFVEEHDSVASLVAFVKPDNVASCRVFDKLNFDFDGIDNESQANRYSMRLTTDHADRLTGE